MMDASKPSFPGQSALRGLGAQFVLIASVGSALVSGMVLAEQIFQGPASLVGPYPFGIAAADLDNDGHLDLVTANLYPPGQASVLFGRGDGGFLPELRLPISGYYAQSNEVLIEDLNGDGFGDVILIGDAGRSVTVYLGIGGRAFHDGIVYWGWGSSDSPFVAGAAADFNRDGHVDIVTGGRRIGLHLGVGDGTLSPPEFLSPGGGEGWILAGQFSSDSCPDFVSDDYQYRFRLWLGNCDGTFFSPSGTDFGVRSQFAAASGDFNGDGMLDVVSVGLAGVCVSLRSNTPQQFHPAVCYDTIAGAGTILAVDLNSDQQPDLVVSEQVYYYSIAAVSVLLSNGDGTFQPSQEYKAPLDGGALTSGDFDADGRIDVALASIGGDTGSDPENKAFPLHGAGLVGVMFGDGIGGVSDERVVRFDAGEGPEAVITADFDGDGLDDVATTNRDSGDVSILRGNGQGSFVEVSRPLVGSGPVALAAGRLDAGSTLDLLVANQDSTDISVLLGNGDGTFEAGQAIAVATVPAALILADLDGNGALDLVVANPEADTVSVYSGLGDGTFQFAVSLPVGDEPVAVAVTDLDGAGGADLVVVNHVSADVSVLLGDGQGGFAAETRYLTGIDGSDSFAGPEAIATADFDRDGFMDLAVGGTAESTLLVVLYGDGEGGLAPPVAYDVSRPVHKLVVADLDGDGWNDLIAGHTYPSVVSVLLGGKDGFAPPREFAAATQPRGVAVGEFNQDGLLDLAITDYYRDNVAVLINQLEVRIEFPSDSTLTWRRLVGYDRFNTYRGDLIDLRSATPSGGECRNAFDPDLTDNVLVDDEVPAEGAGFFYLMSRVRGGVESDLGSASGGQPRVPAIPCE